MVGFSGVIDVQVFVLSFGLLFSLKHEENFQYTDFRGLDSNSQYLSECTF